MSPLRSTILALVAIGALGITNFGANVVGNVISHVLVPPAIYVLPTKEVEVPVYVPSVDHDLCVQVLAQDVRSEPSACLSCHPSQTIVINQDLIDGWLEIPPDNGADTDTGGGIRPDQWIPGEAIGL